MGERASLIATLAEPPDDGVLAALPRSVDWLELRADLCGEIPAAWLRERFAGRLLYTLRSRGEGGAFEGSLASRRQRLAAAAADFDWVDLEADRDLTDSLLEAVPAEKRVLSWHGAGREASQLERQFQTMAQVPAALYKLVPLARESSEEVATLELLVDLGPPRRPLLRRRRERRVDPLRGALPRRADPARRRHREGRRTGSTHGGQDRDATIPSPSYRRSTRSTASSAIPSRTRCRRACTTAPIARSASRRSTFRSVPPTSPTSGSKWSKATCSARSRRCAGSRSPRRTRARRRRSPARCRRWRSRSTAPTRWCCARACGKARPPIRRV